MKIDLRIDAPVVTNEAARKDHPADDLEALDNRSAVAANDNEQTGWPFFPFPDDWFATS